MRIKSDARRNKDGSIDIAFYKRRAQRIAREARKARAELVHFSLAFTVLRNQFCGDQ